MATKSSNDTSLQCKIVRSRLIISVPVLTLAYAFEESEYNTEYCEETGRFTRTLKVANPIVFAQDVILALTKEKEDGATLLTDLLDKACQGAVGDGSLGVKEDGSVI